MGLLSLIRKLLKDDAKPMYYKRFDSTLPTLFKEDEKNAGYDLFARLDNPIVIMPNNVAMIPLNLATEIPVEGVGLLFQRSSTYKKWGIKLTNGVGVIDCLYCGDGDEWCGQFKNETNSPVTINRGDKICQAVFVPLLNISPVESNVLGNDNRGGFGTSGANASELK
jgi:dUTP pyrophosphatase